jgi:hypothetical protein
VQGLGLLISSDLRVRLTDPSISLVPSRFLFVLYGDSQTASEEFDQYVFLKQVLNK